MTLVQEQPLDQIDLGPGEDDFHYVCPICWLNDEGTGPRGGTEYVITACGIALDVGDYAEQGEEGVDCAACVATLRIRQGFPCGHTNSDAIGWIDAHRWTP